MHARPVKLTLAFSDRDPPSSVSLSHQTQFMLHRIRAFWRCSRINKARLDAIIINAAVTSNYFKDTILRHKIAGFRNQFPDRRRSARSTGPRVLETGEQADISRPRSIAIAQSITANASDLFNYSSTRPEVPLLRSFSNRS